MPRLIYLAAARRDIAEIAAYIERESGRGAAADSFIDKITDYCQRVSQLPGLLGRARPEFGRDYRSVTYGSYVIFMRYADEDGPRSHLYVVHIIHAARDLDAYFVQHDDSL